MVAILKGKSMALRAVTSNGVAITPSSLTVSGTLTGSSGTATAASISPTINQSGTAGYTALDINSTETATGSGTKLLQRWAVGGSEVGRMSNGGVFGASAGVLVGNSGALGFASALTSATQDVYIGRDAADTLALRRSTNAQTFRVYNTYTDGSNYERGIVQWVAGDFQIGTQAAGTGTGRNLTFLANGDGAWRVTSSGGHFLAVTDNFYDIGASGATRPRTGYFGTSVVTPYLAITDGIAAPGAGTGVARLYVDTADGDLKVVFADGTIKTIVTDT